MMRRKRGKKGSRLEDEWRRRTGEEEKETARERKLLYWLLKMLENRHSGNVYEGK